MSSRSSGQDWATRAGAGGRPLLATPYGPYPGESAYFLAANRNKRSITVNLKSTRARRSCAGWPASSDVLVENFRTGVLDRMGWAMRTCLTLNPRLVYCSISGYGRTGPYAGASWLRFCDPGRGWLHGYHRSGRRSPDRVGVPIVDIAAGMFAATAILAALRARDLTGEGQLVDVSLLDAQVALLTNVASNYLIGGQGHRRLGNAHPKHHPLRSFRGSGPLVCPGGCQRGAMGSPVRCHRTA